MNLLTLLPKDIIDQIISYLNPEFRCDLLDVLVEIPDSSLFAYYAKKMITTLKIYRPQWFVTIIFYGPAGGPPLYFTCDSFSTIKNKILLHFTNQPLKEIDVANDIHQLITCPERPGQRKIVKNIFHQISCINVPSSGLKISFSEGYRLWFEITIERKIYCE